MLGKNTMAKLALATSKFLFCFILFYFALYIQKVELFESYDMELLYV
jgi:hypothetical protein